MKKIVNSNMTIGDVEVTIDGYVHYSVDNFYGEDADGKRGVQRITVDDVTDISGYDNTLNKVALTKEDIDWAGAILTREFLEN